MSWSINKLGRAGKLSASIKSEFEKVGGAPPGTGEEAAKNALGAVAEALCVGMADALTIVSIKASGSAWTDENRKHKTADTRFEFSTLGPLVE